MLCGNTEVRVSRAELVTQFLNAPRSYTMYSLSLCIIYWDVIIATEANFRLASLVSKTERDDPSSGDGVAAAAAGNQLQRLQLI